MKSGATTTSRMGLEFVRYFPRQLITADDMVAEQRCLREKFRRHNRFLHGWGVVCGCQVTAPTAGDPPWQVMVQGGYVVTPRGDEILIPGPIAFDLAGDWRQPYNSCPEPVACQSRAEAIGNDLTTAYLAVCYTECNVRPVRTHHAGCGCDDAACEYSRIRESFELVCLDQLPDSHTEANALDADWHTWLATGQLENRLPDCPLSIDEDCVVLASIKLPPTAGTGIVSSDITYGQRRVLLNTSMQQAALLATTQSAPS